MRAQMILFLGLVTACSAGETTRPPGPDIPPALPPARLMHTKYDGDGQNAAVYSELPLPLRIRVMRNNDPVAGVYVRWSRSKPSGDVQPDSSMSDANGYALARYTMGATVGPEFVTAEIAEDSESFYFYATSGPQAQLIADTTFSFFDPEYAWVAGRVLDAYGNGVGTPVYFDVLSGDAVVFETIGDSDGSSGVFWAVLRMGPPPNTVTVSATVAGLAPIIFEVTRN